MIAAARWAGVTEQGLVGTDYAAYRVFAERFLETGSQYLPEQLTGPYDSQPVTGPPPSMYPPVALLLFLPFAPLPALAWWLLPIGLTAWCLRGARPPLWTWPLIAGALAWPETTTIVMVGNTTMWGVAAVAAGARYGWPAVLLAIKPTLLPFAVVAVRRRSFWVACAIVALASVPLATEWSRWIVAVGNGSAGAGYSFGSYPALGAAWLLASRRSSAPNSATPEPS